MKSEKKGFALLMEWAGQDKGYIYASIALALFGSVSTIVPYFAFYKIIDAVVLGVCTFDFALRWAVILLAATARQGFLRAVFHPGVSPRRLQHFVQGAMHGDGAHGEDAHGDSQPAEHRRDQNRHEREH